MWWLVGLAHATTLSGYGVPVAGGVFGGPNATGGPGLAWSPAAAAVEFTDITLDVGLLVSRFSYELASADAPISSTSASPVPSVGIAAPVGPIALGATVFAPLARGGGQGDPNGDQRFYGISGGLRAIEGDLILAVPFGDWEIGLAGRVVQGSIASEKAVDTGALLYQLVGDIVPIGDPFLEGTQQLNGLSGFGLGAAGGLRYLPEGKPGFSAYYRSMVRPTLDGELVLVPSNDLSLQVEGDVSVAMTVPAEAGLALLVPMEDARLELGVGWVGWGAGRYIKAQLSELSIVSEDPVMDGLLQSYGLSEATFLDSLQTSTTDTGMHDTWSLSVMVDSPLSERVALRAGTLISTAAVPTAYLHPSNADFGSIDLRGGMRYIASNRLDLSFGLDWFFAGMRKVEDSVFAPTNPAGTTLPPANGTYALNAARAGLTVQYYPGL